MLKSCVLLLVFLVKVFKISKMRMKNELKRIEMPKVTIYSFIVKTPIKTFNDLPFKEGYCCGVNSYSKKDIGPVNDIIFLRMVDIIPTGLPAEYSGDHWLNELGSVRSY